MGRTEIIVAAAVTSIEEGHVLHVRAERAPASRTRGTAALGAVDCTVGPSARGSFLVVDYGRVRSGEEDHHETAEAAVRAVRRLLTWDRVAALSVALVAIHGQAETAEERDARHGRFLREAQELYEGRRLRAFAESRPPLRGPLFGPGFGPFGR